MALTKTWTTLGLQKQVNCLLNGDELGIKYIAVGDGSGAVPTPSEDDTALVNEVWRGEISEITDNSPQFTAITYIPEDEGDFIMRELGIFDEDGNLLFIAQMDETPKYSTDTTGLIKEIGLKVVFELQNGLSAVVADPSSITATCDYVTQAVENATKNLADTDLSNLTDTGVDLIRVVTDGVYEPVNLEEKFADEIAEYSSVWTWIQARIQAADFSGIHIGDYIPLTLTGGAIGSDYEITEGQEHKMQVAGIDTYYNSGDSAIPHHIDFISMNTIGEYILFNGGASNNGTASEPNPWLASGVYAVLNGVNNYTTSAYNSLKHGYDASSTGGVLQMLPDDLQSVIITKRTWAEEQYSSSALVNYPTGYGWKDYGYLWVPHEIEVCGYQPCSYNNGTAISNGNLTKGSFKMYPLFRYSTRIRTSADDNETRQVYWSCVPSNSAATKMCGAGGTGIMDSITTSTSNISVCFGFRIG